MNIVFYNRDFTGAVPLNLDIQIERYSHAMLGGPDTATLKIRPTSDKWELTKLLRCPVEIFGEDGSHKWWGYADRVVIPHGKIRVGLGLDELYNSVSVKHKSGTTSASLDAQSVGEYGTKEYYIDLSNAPESDATAFRATYLETHKYAVPELELSGGGDEIIMECYGWWKTLSWMNYADPSTIPVENTTQIANMIASCGQFIRGVVVHDTAGISTIPTRDGSNNAQVYITELLNAGSINARPMLATVDKDRYIHIYERIAETAEYIMRDDGNLETLLGKIVQPENCVCAAWVAVKGVPDTLGGISVMRPFFIDRAENVIDDPGPLSRLKQKRESHVQYSSAGAFAQTRLDKYLKQNISNFNGVPFTFPSIGFGGSIPIDTGASLVIAKRAIVHDINAGPFFTATLDSTSPFWIRWNAGLTEEQYQLINRIKVCPNGAIYVGFTAADDTRIFLACAPYLGAAFTVVEDYDSIHAKCGSIYATRFYDFEVNPAEAEQIICAYNVSGIDEMHMYIGSGTSWTGGAIFTSPWVCKISAGLDNWFLTSSGHYFVLTGDAASVITSGSVFSYLVTDHARLGGTNDTLHWDDGNLYMGHNYLTTYDTLDSSGVFPGIFGISPDGSLMLTNRISASPLQSSNMGATFSEVATLPVDLFAFAFIGGDGLNSQWLGVGTEHGYIYYTEDFWQSTPVSKLGNLLDLVASPQLNMVTVLV